MVSVGSPPARCAIYFNGDGSMSPISDRYYIDTIRVGIYSSPISIWYAPRRGLISVTRTGCILTSFQCNLIVEFSSNLAFKWGFLA